MARIRRGLSWLAVVWLVCQAASFTAGPTMAALGLDVDECCRHLGPGQSCPMHHAREGDTTCKMRSACPRADFALISIGTTLGILTGSTDVVTVFVPGEAAPALEAFAPTRSDRPEAPPPRV
jgi:hypothetical protein